MSLLWTAPGFCGGQEDITKYSSWGLLNIHLCLGRYSKRPGGRAFVLCVVLGVVGDRKDEKIRISSILHQEVIYFQSIVIDRVFDVIDLYIFRVFSDSLKYLDIPVDNLVSNNHVVFLGATELICMYYYQLLGLIFSLDK